MPEVTRNRTIRPSTRKDTSVNYRIDIKGITAADTLVVNIGHESKPFRKTFKFKGSDVTKKKSLGFTVFDDGKNITITWISTQPIYG
ncbi:MAG TPA: hypothetical protein VG738_08785 [Chitinophagaceae bacterium]|nr:hypothetical protein [Chitinophagaceae bacterium]